MNIQTLALTNKGTTISSEVENFLLTNLSYGFIDSFDIVWDVGDVLYRSVVSDNHVLHIIIPKTNVDEFTSHGQTTWNLNAGTRRVYILLVFNSTN